MSKPLIYKSWAGELWYCSNYLYRGEGVTPKEAYEDWVKNKEQYTYDLLSKLNRTWKYQGNPKEDYSNLVWYKRWWKRFADIWKGD